MTARSFIGSGSMAETAPIKGVDGIIGVVIMLAYLVNGKNLFPAGIRPMEYVREIKEVPGGSVIVMDDEQLSQLIDICATTLGRYLKGLTMGSLKVYLSNLRNGKRPNGGVLPQVNTFYSASTGQIRIAGRDYDLDVATGTFDRVPDWVRAIAQ
jgi:hypothetical protein